METTSSNISELDREILVGSRENSDSHNVLSIASSEGQVERNEDIVPPHEDYTRTESTSSDSQGSSYELRKCLLETADPQQARQRLETSLQEEQKLLILQMKLLSQLESLNTSIVETESEARFATLALQRANVNKKIEACKKAGKEMETQAESIRLRSL